MTPDDPRHGTEKGRYAHERAGQPLCAACRDAINRYERRRRKSRTLYSTRWNIDATGTRRRLQALHVLGWRGQDIAERIGTHQARISQLTVGKQAHVHRATAAAAARVYDELSMTLGPSTITRRRSIERGWAPPLAWDDDTIDNPRARPNYGNRAPDKRESIDESRVDRMLHGERLPSTTPAEKREAMARWLAWGRSEAEFCRLMGWKAGRYTPRKDAA